MSVYIVTEISTSHDWGDPYYSWDYTCILFTSTSQKKAMEWATTFVVESSECRMRAIQHWFDDNQDYPVIVLTKWDGSSHSEVDRIDLNKIYAPLEDHESWEEFDPDWIELR